MNGGGQIDIAWAPSWDLRLTFALDGLAVLYALLATGIGFLVIVCSSRYIASHLKHQQRPASDQVGFYGFLLLFMGGDGRPGNGAGSAAHVRLLGYHRYCVVLPHRL
jgi:multicomponent Na+:H+ antiporter subunit A